MKKIVNKYIPFKGFEAMTIWPFIFIREGERFTERTERHEYIHGEQQKELLIVLFYLLYVVEWLIRCIIYGNTSTAYHNISFEREAYDDERDILYLEKRKHYAWVKFIFKK